MLRLLALVASAVAAALIGAETLVRLLDGFPLLPLRLPLFPPRVWLSPPRPRTLASLAAALGSAPDTDPGWIDEAPPPLANRRPPDTELLALRRAVRFPNVQEHNLYSAWNQRFVDQTACSTFNVLPLLPMPIFVFDPPEPAPHPPYRYLPGRTTPRGLTTNAFGWRGPEIPLDKPAATIRLAFVGASTTVGLHEMPFSYPEYVLHWLNRWAARSSLGVRFDGLNAGRGGIVSTDIAAIVRQEVLPLEPDLVVYYEGANQFVFADPLTDAGRDAGPLAKGRPPAVWDRFTAAAGSHSALVRRANRTAQVLASRGGREPAKPAYMLRWPAGVDPAEPDIGRPDLPLKLSTILADLESIRSALAAAGAELAVSSFVWLASDGLRLDVVRHALVYQWLNERCWPYRYADIRALADFQNLVLRRYAAAHDLPFVDVAGSYPMDPDLFFDAIHFGADGTRVHAWIVVQSLLPLLRQRIASGSWPRPDREPLGHHPAFGPLRRHVVPCAAAGAG